MVNAGFDGVAFDLEGTMVNIESVHHTAHILVASEAGVKLDLSNLEDVLVKVPHFIGGPGDKIAEEIFALSDGRMSKEEILRRDEQYYDLGIKDVGEIKPRPGLTEVVQRLSYLGVPIATGSLTATDRALFLMEKSGITRLFPRDRIILREDVKELKPAMDVYLKTAERMGINTSRQLVFEDSPNGIKAAIRAGSQAVGMPVYHEKAAISALLDAGAKKIFKSWKEVDIDRLLRGEFEYGHRPESL